MFRSLASAIILLAVLASSCFAQTQAAPKTLQALSQELETHPDLGRDPTWLQVDPIINGASPAEIKQVLPSLVKLTESQDARQREDALLLIYGIAMRQKVENRGESDDAARQLIVPYIPRLAPRLFDPDTPSRGAALLIFMSLVAVHPTPPDLLATAIHVLQDSRSTTQLADTTKKSPDGKAPSIGPQMLSVLLAAGATFYRDPATGMIEGKDSPEVQQAILAFLRRPDQTTVSRSESIRALALAQPQNTAINAELLRWLDLPDTNVQMNLMRHLANLTLTPEDFSSGKARVTQLSKDPAVSAEVRSLANELLGCWTNDRHHTAMCPPPHP